jgi:hypothetical protein
MRPFYRTKGKRPMASVQPGNEIAPSGGQYYAGATGSVGLIGLEWSRSNRDDESPDDAHCTRLSNRFF